MRVSPMMENVPDTAATESAATSVTIRSHDDLSGRVARGVTLTSRFRR
jgi:hypothetical protein